MTPVLDDAHETPVRLTERMMLDLLHDRYSQTSQGSSRRYVCAEHVAEHAGWTDVDGAYRDPRRADFLAQDCWASKGLELHGHEVKVSRADWLTESARPHEGRRDPPLLRPVVAGRIRPHHRPRRPARRVGTPRAREGRPPARVEAGPAPRAGVSAAHVPGDPATGRRQDRYPPRRRLPMTTDPATLRRLRRRLRAMSQDELEEYIDTQVREGRDDGPAWDAAYQIWEEQS